MILKISHAVCAPIAYLEMCWSYKQDAVPILEVRGSSYLYRSRISTSSNLKCMKSNNQIDKIQAFGAKCNVM